MALARSWKEAQVRACREQGSQRDMRGLRGALVEEWCIQVDSGSTSSASSLTIVPMGRSPSTPSGFLILEERRKGAAASTLFLVRRGTACWRDAY